MFAIDLPANIETTIFRMAERQGITAEKVLTNIVTQHFAENPFNFDLETIQKSIDSGFKPVPKFNTPQELANWLGGDK